MQRSERTRAVRAGGAIVAALMLWSVIGNVGASIGEEAPPSEPSGLSAYSTFADAMPVQSYFDHQARLIPLGPAIAHSQSEVALPSTASGIAWLVDGGVANGLHGTTTGNRVPTEASAKAPGGDDEEEYKVAGGPIGDDNFAAARAGRAYARAEYTDTPTGYANAFFGNLYVLPGAGAVGDDPPGTFDPDATPPNQDSTDMDPQPKGQMGLLSIGKVASTARSIRDDATVTSIGVSELHDINLGNRTSDNRCTNCIRIDLIRTEAYAQANGQKEGARAAYRVTLGRACRRGFDGPTGKEVDQCLPLDPHDPEGTKGLQSFDDLEKLNEQFEKPVWTVITGGQVDYAIGFRIHAGNPHCSPARAQRTASPKDDPCRNYASPKKGEGNTGEVAKAVAEGLDVELWTVTFSQAFDDVEHRVNETPAREAIRAIDQDDDERGIQLCAPGQLCSVTGQQTIPTDSVSSVRRVHVTLGVARAVAVARPQPVALAPVDGGGGIGGPSVPAPGGDVSVPPGGPPAPATAGPGLGGKLKLRIDWATLAVKPWPPYDMAKGIAAGAIALAAGFFIRRRMAPG